MTLRIAIIAVLMVCVVGCGRTAPVAAVSAEQVADICFDQEAELTALLDDDYLAAETPIIDEAGVREIAFDSEEDLTALLDDNYLSIDTVILDEQDVADIAFDETELTLVLDDVYERIGGVQGPIDYFDLVNRPNGLDDGDDDTVYTGVPPIIVDDVADTVALDETGCANGEILTFVGGNFTCALPAPVTAAGVEGLGNAANNTAPIEALPFITKLELTNVAVGAAVPSETTIYAVNAAPVSFLIVDAWVVTGTVTGTVAFELRDQAQQISAPVTLPTVAGSIARATNFNANAAFRNINRATDELNIQLTSAAGATVTLTVFVIGMPL